MRSTVDFADATERGDAAGVHGGAPGWPLGVARIITGWLWATQLIWKLPPNFGCVEPHRVVAETGGGLCDWVGREIAYPNPFFPWFASLLQATVAPNLGFFGWLIFLAEVFIAVSLFFGIVARLGGLVGVLMA